MNKAITDGLQLMPPAFAGGLAVWSRENGTPGTDTYDGAADAALVAADQDFGGCLELQKTQGTQRLRFMGETPLAPGCYLRIRARIKAMSGNLPSVRIAAWAGNAAKQHVGGVTEVGPATALTGYGEVIEVSAIVGSGLRGGVDMVWGAVPVYGHFGLDLTGQNGGIVRIDDIEIEDVTSVFLRDMLAQVDVRDYGAVGDGTTDDSAAFEAADDAAEGRRILVPAGTYYIGQNITINNPIRFEGTLSAPDSSILSFLKSYDLDTYIAAMGNEAQGFRKAIQSLFNNSDHESLDMGGRRVSVTGPIDMAQTVNNKTAYAQRRVVRNGQLYAEGDAAWDPRIVTAQGTYSPSTPMRISGISAISQIEVGMLVQGNGVGREIYVNAVNAATQEVTLSHPLYDGAGTQNFTFTRYRYMLDFSGFAQLSKFGLEGVEFQCNSKANGVMMARAGSTNTYRDCYFTRPAHRAITSIGTACQGMLVDRCHFATRENGQTTQNRVSIAINGNSNDIKLRNNWASQHRHFAVLSGSSNVITGNHFFQGDGVSGGVRTAGVVLTDSNCSTTIVGNYIDNCHIEWTNEHDAQPDFSGGFGFAALSITNNNFLCGDVAPWFAFVVVKPFGTGHSVKGLNITGNMFRVVGGTIDRVDRVDTTHADLNYNGMRNINVAGNAFNNIVTGVANPQTIIHDQGTAAATWAVDCAPRLLFGGRTKRIESAVVTERLRTAANQTRYLAPYAVGEQGGNGGQVHLHWEEPVRGEVTMTVRMDR